jgi:hypothetical protein
MPNQIIKYPLTAEAKEDANQLAMDWKTGKIAQFFTVFDATAGAAHEIEISGGLGVENHYNLPPLKILLELSKFKLIFVDYEILPSGRGYQKQWHILLMQELHNAVETDFAVSDYFLTMNAVGTVITAHEGSTVEIRSLQSAASNYGNIDQQMSVVEISDELSTTLGVEFLESNSQLATAIQELRTSIDSERESKLGNVISELGRCLQHGANAFVVAQALGFLTHVMN